MADYKESMKQNGKYEVKTSMSYQTYEFRWTLENFSQWPKICRLRSEEFQPSKDIILYAMLDFYINKFGNMCRMYLISKVMTTFQIELFYSIVGSDGKIFQDVSNDGYNYDEQNQSYYFSINPNLLEAFDKLTKDNILIFELVLEISAPTTITVHRRFPQNSSILLPTVLEDFKSMFSDSLYTDLTLSVGNNHLRVHKSVLSARSPVFAKMLESPMDEKERDVIKISDIDLPILKTFIEFLYSGDMPDAEFETACALYYAADKYEVPSLQEECANILLGKLNAENSCQVLALADRHSDQELKDLVLHFMQSQFDAILGTDSWMDFIKVESDLAVEVMKLRAQMLEERSSS